MNPYYDPEWSVLPPENNRRYVCLYEIYLVHVLWCYLRYLRTKCIYKLAKLYILIQV